VAKRDAGASPWHPEIYGSLPNFPNYSCSQAGNHPAVAVTHVIPSSRFALGAFERRAFYQGVCDAYTQIRRDGRVPAAPQRSWKDLLRLHNPTADGVRQLMARVLCRHAISPERGPRRSQSA